MILPRKTLFSLLPFILQVKAQASGTGTTTRYWDCCKPSCAWPGKTTLASGANPVAMCDIHDNPITDYNAASGCSGGTAFMPSSESPWAVTDDLAYGYAAVNIAGGDEASWCCACYELTFTSGAVAGKKMIVQATNTGGDLGSNQFDLSIPGGGVGLFNGCTAEWGAPSTGWGAQYGGISDRSGCDAFPEALQAGCYWRFDWFMGADNPAVSFTQVTCPAALTAKTGCVRAGETPTGASVVADTGSSAATAATSSISPAVLLQSPETSTTPSAAEASYSPATVIPEAQAPTTAVEIPVVASPTPTSATADDVPAISASTSTPSAEQTTPLIIAGPSSTLGWTITSSPSSKTTYYAGPFSTSSTATDVSTASAITEVSTSQTTTEAPEVTTTIYDCGL